MAQVAPSAASRGPSNRPPSPAPASAAASAMFGAPKRACAGAEGVRMRSACALSAASGSAVSATPMMRAASMSPGSSALAASVNIRRSPSGAPSLFERAARERRDRLACNARAAANADGDDST